MELAFVVLGFIFVFYFHSNGAHLSDFNTRLYGGAAVTQLVDCVRCDAFWLRGKSEIDVNVRGRAVIARALWVAGV